MNHCCFPNPEKKDTITIDVLIFSAQGSISLVQRNTHLKVRMPISIIFYVSSVQNVCITDKNAKQKEKFVLAFLLFVNTSICDLWTFKLVDMNTSNT